MRRLLLHSLRHLASPNCNPCAAAPRVAPQTRESRYRRASFEQLEDRRALATVTLGLGAVPQSADAIPLAHFEAAAFPQVIQISSDLHLAPDATPGSGVLSPTLRSAGQPEPRLVLPSADGRPVATSIDRIQATAGIVTNVRLKQGMPSDTGRRAAVVMPAAGGQEGSNHAPAIALNPIGRSSPATTLPGRSEASARPLPVTAEAKKIAPLTARALVADRANEAVTKRAGPAPHRSSAASPQSASGDYITFARQSPSMTRDDREATDLLFTAPRRPMATSQADSSPEAQDYLSDVQTVIFAAAAVATALVLPGVVSEIRRRRNRTLPQFAPEPQRAALTSERSDRATENYPMREKAG